MPELTSSEYEAIGRAKVLGDTIAALMAEMAVAHEYLVSLLAAAKDAYAEDQMSLIAGAYDALSTLGATLAEKRTELKALVSGGTNDNTP